MKRHLPFVILFALLSAGSGQAEPYLELGRLLTTPEERMTMEEHRHQKQTACHHTSPVEVNEEEGEDEDATVEKKTYTLNGLVLREDGQHVAWINAESNRIGSVTSEGVSTERSEIEGDRLPLHLPDGGQRVILRPGQSYDTASRRIVDVVDITEKQQ